MHSLDIVLFHFQLLQLGVLHQLFLTTAQFFAKLNVVISLGTFLLIVIQFDFKYFGVTNISCSDYPYIYVFRHMYRQLQNKFLEVESLYQRTHIFNFDKQFNYCYQRTCTYGLLIEEYIVISSFSERLTLVLCPYFSVGYQSILSFLYIKVISLLSCTFSVFF